MTQKNDQKIVKVATVIITASEAAKHGYPEIFRSEQVKKLDLYKGTSIEVKSVKSLNTRELTVKKVNGQEQSIELDNLQFVHITESFAKHIIKS